MRIRRRRRQLFICGYMLYQSHPTAGGGAERENTGPNGRAMRCSEHAGKPASCRGQRGEWPHPPGSQLCAAGLPRTSGSALRGAAAAAAAAGQVTPQQLMRVYGALMWSLGKVCERGLLGGCCSDALPQLPGGSPCAGSPPSRGCLAVTRITRARARASRATLVGAAGVNVRKKL